MSLEILTANARYLTWAPTPVSLRFSPPEPAGPPVALTLSGASAAGGTGQLSFRAKKTDPPQDSMSLAVPTDGTPVEVFVSGRKDALGQTASIFDGDVSLVVTRAGNVVASIPVMVRIRKNANALTDDERIRFLSALGTLNARGQGVFQLLRDMHKSGTLREAHGDRGFLPWHRVYLLDLERRLQAIDPSVALPYWRFDQPAPNVFTADFMGVTLANGTVDFSAANPLDNVWAGDGGALVFRRRPIGYDPTTSGAMIFGQPVRSESQTLESGSNYAAFTRPDFGIEDKPHNDAHSSFSGLIGNPVTAPTDPLFFLLHCNIDRLWAKWQKGDQSRVDPASPASFADSVDPIPDGHRRADTMWPWNGVITSPRPNPAPGGGLPSSSTSKRPTAAPACRDVIDWQGRLAPAGSIGYDYDDVSW